MVPFITTGLEKSYTLVAPWCARRGAVVRMPTANAMRMSDRFVMLPFTLSFSGRIIRFHRGRWKTYANSGRDTRDVHRWSWRRELDDRDASDRTRPGVGVVGRWLCCCAGCGRQPGPDRPLRRRERLAEGHQHRARQREVDLRRRAGCLCREPESHFHAVPRRAAEDG